MSKSSGNVHELPGSSDTNESILAQPNQELLDAIADMKESEDKIKEDRDKLNADKSAGRKGLIAKYALNMAAFDAAVAYVSAPEKKQENFDLSYIVCRQALGAPLQLDMFVNAQIGASTKQAEKQVAAGR